MIDLKRRQQGMTLVELMIVIVIIGILTAIALPSYRGYILRANRTDAKKALLARAADFERCFTRNSTYLNSDSTPCTVAANLPDSTLSTYRIEADPDNNNIQQATFAIRAVPINQQAKDTQCGMFRLDDRNNRTVSGTASASDCWGR